MIEKKISANITSANKLIFRGRIIEVRLEQCVLPNGQEVELEIIRHPGGAAAVAINTDEKICLIYQYRHATGGWLWELPAGKIDPEEPPLHTAQRELIEEAGVAASNWSSLGILHSSPGILTEIIYLYLATNLEPRTQALGRDEVLEVHWIPLKEALEWAISGKITDAKTLIGLFRAAIALNKLESS